MTFSLHIRDSALAEVAEAIAFYESRRNGLGQRFKSALELTVEGLAEFPNLGLELLPGVRRVLVPRFKYRVFYVVNADQVVVIGIYHPSRSFEDLPRRLLDD
ncbi:MAG: type II toxin-antitoxin system RelE/ParE family toxin [Planctomycetota bacterium]|nr:type II toxin-antitoxin system RelE/ParE family toxin [Planctomycetota bacterium]